MTDDTTLKAHTLFNTGYFIDGQWHTSDTTFDVENPATGEVLAWVAKASKTETDAAIAAAAKAFPAWRAKTLKNVRKCFTAGISSLWKSGLSSETDERRAGETGQGSHR